MASRTVHITILALSCMIVHSFVSEVEALEHCDREKGCDRVFGGSFFERIGEEGFEGGFSGERLMKASNVEDKEKHAGEGSFRSFRSFGEQRRFKPRGPGGPGDGAIGLNIVDANNLRQRDGIIA